MARILIFDSTATQNDADEPVEMGLARNVYATSMPVRMHGGPSGDQRHVSYEFIVSSDEGFSTNIEWYQEFFNDHPWVNMPSALPASFRATTIIPARPTYRVFPGSSNSMPWAREQVAIAGAAGVIDHYDITRVITTAGVAKWPDADCRYYPMLVHALWVRIKIRVTDAGSGDLPDYPRIRVFAHAGGLGNIASYTERSTRPFSGRVQNPE